MDIGSFFHSIGHAIASFFGSHQAAIQLVIKDAQLAAGTATAVATSLGEPDSVTAKISEISDGLSKVSSAVTSETTATDLKDHAANLTNLVVGLVGSGDIGIKNDETKAAIGATAIKVQSVVGAIETAAQATP